MNLNKRKAMDLFDTKNTWEEILVKEGALQIRRCSAATRYDHFLGVAADGRYLYLLQLPIKFAARHDILPKIAGCTSGIVKYKGKEYFCLALKVKENWAIFKLLTREIVRDLEQNYKNSGIHIINQLHTTMKRCERFFERADGKFTKSQALGLLGELYFLKVHVIPAVGKENALSCWKGPLGTPQDFSVEDTTVEIKSTESASKQAIRISNAEQLSTSAEKGFLWVMRVSSGTRESEKTISLQSLIADLMSEFENIHGGIEMFHSMLDIVGYSAESLESTRPYQILNCAFYELREGFPRITPSMLPQGIESVQYTINLNICDSFIQSPGWIQQ